MAAQTCPRCGFAQESGEECARCGVVFARARAAGGPRPTVGTAGPPPLAVPPAASRALDEPERRGWFGRAYRILRWAMLASLIVGLLLILRTSSPPEVAVDPEAAARVETKLAQTSFALARGSAQPLALDEPELNGWLHASLALAPAGGSARSADPGVEQMRSNVRDVRVQLVDDHVRAWVLFDLYGKDLTLTLEARPSVRDGSLHLEPLGGWLGSLPIPATALERGFARGLAHPANADKLRLPPYVAGIRVEGGRLIIIPSTAAVGTPQLHAPGARPAAPEGVGASAEPDAPPEETPAPSQEE